MYRNFRTIVNIIYQHKTDGACMPDSVKHVIEINHCYGNC